MAFELTTTGFIASFFKTTGLAGKQEIERWLYLEVALAVLGGCFGTGHHYYWIGFPAYWLILGTIFSLLQVVPVFMLVHMTYKGLKKKTSKNHFMASIKQFILSYNRSFTLRLSIRNSLG